MLQPGQTFLTPGIFYGDATARPSVPYRPAQQPSYNSAGPSGETVTVSIQVISSDRFAVKSAHNKKLYTLYRSIPGWNYDADQAQFDYPKDAYVPLSAHPCRFMAF